MEALAQYILTVTSAAMIFGILQSLLDKKGSAAALIQFIGGLFLAFTVIKPVANLNFEIPTDIPFYLSVEGIRISEQGQEIAHSQLYNSIKQRCETYILDKALDYQTPLGVQIQLSQDNVPIPIAVCLKGSTSPFVKNSLQVWLEENMGISRENQLWIE